MVAEKAALPVVIRRMLIREGPISNLSCCARIAGPSFLGCIDCISRFFLPPLQLVLRKWANLVPGMEFRCFVRDDLLLAVSQRNHRQHYPYIEKEKVDLATEIQRFVTDEVIGKFRDNRCKCGFLLLRRRRVCRAW